MQHPQRHTLAIVCSARQRPIRRRRQDLQGLHQAIVFNACRIRPSTRILRISTYQHINTHQAINAYVKPIRFGSSSCSSPPGNFFAFCCASWHLLRHLQAVFSLSSVSFLRMRMLGDLEVLWIATAKLWQCHLDLPALAELLLCSCGP